MSKRGSNARFRKETFDAHKRTNSRGVYLVCNLCGVRLDPVRDGFEADHIVALAAGGKDCGTTNGQPLCVPCHRAKTGSEDAPRIAKIKRTRDKHFNLKDKRQGFRGWRNFKGEPVFAKDKR